MAQPIAPDYDQPFLLPPALEDWVPADHPARFLREFVAQLDLPALGFATPACADGRPPYAPSLLLKIWLYGYLQRIRATRQLETACREHLSLLWLTGLLQPDHHSLWRFWRANQTALREVYHPAEAEARRMKTTGGNRYAYNAQAVSDARAGSSPPPTSPARKPTPANSPP